MSESVRWEKVPNRPGVYRRTGARGRIIRHVYRDQLGRQESCNRCRNVEAAWKHQGEKANHRPEDVTVGRITLQQGYDALHADPRASYSPATLAAHESFWRALREAAPKMATTPMNDIGEAALRPALKKITKPSMADKTRQLVGLIYRHAGVNPNPATKPYSPRTRAARMAEDREVGQYLDRGDVERMISAAPERYRFLLRLLWRTGLRPGEAFALTVGQYNPETATLTIDRAVNDGVIGPTKTGKVRRPILAASIAAELTTYIRDYSDWTNPDALVFTTTAGKPINSDDFRRRVWNVAAETAGIEKATPYWLRHTFASDALAAGCDLASVAEMCGHGIEVLARVYVHYSEEAGRRAADMLDRVR